MNLVSFTRTMQAYSETVSLNDVEETLVKANVAYSDAQDTLKIIESGYRHYENT